MRVLGLLRHDNVLRVAPEERIDELRRIDLGPSIDTEGVEAVFEALGVNRFDFKYSAGPMTPEQSLNNIRAYATEVAPMVTSLLADQAA